MDGLSTREQEVLSKLREGKSNKEIGGMLGISPRTVQKHLQRVYQHLGVRTRAEAIVRTQSRMQKFSGSRA
jgi:DNA-binding NarL/FixJ family response regulator